MPRNKEADPIRSAQDLLCKLPESDEGRVGLFLRFCCFEGFVDIVQWEAVGDQALCIQLSILHIIPKNLLAALP